MTIVITQLEMDPAFLDSQWTCPSTMRGVNPSIQFSILGKNPITRQRYDTFYIVNKNGVRHRATAILHGRQMEGK